MMNLLSNMAGGNNPVVKAQEKIRLAQELSYPCTAESVNMAESICEIIADGYRCTMPPALEMSLEEQGTWSIKELKVMAALIPANKGVVFKTGSKEGSKTCLAIMQSPLGQNFLREMLQEHLEKTTEYDTSRRASVIKQIEHLNLSEENKNAILSDKALCREFVRQKNQELQAKLSDIKARLANPQTMAMVNRKERQLLAKHAAEWFNEGASVDSSPLPNDAAIAYPVHLAHFLTVLIRHVKFTKKTLYSVACNAVQAILMWLNTDSWSNKRADLEEMMPIKVMDVDVGSILRDYLTDKDRTVPVNTSQDAKKQQPPLNITPLRAKRIWTGFLHGRGSWTISNLRGKHFVKAALDLYATETEIDRLLKMNSTTAETVSQGMISKAAVWRAMAGGENFLWVLTGLNAYDPATIIRTAIGQQDGTDVTGEQFHLPNRGWGMLSDIYCTGQAATMPASSASPAGPNPRPRDFLDLSKVPKAVPGPDTARATKADKKMKQRQHRTKRGKTPPKDVDITGFTPVWSKFPKFMADWAKNNLAMPDIMRMQLMFDVNGDKLTTVHKKVLSDIKSGKTGNKWYRHVVGGIGTYYTSKEMRRGLTIFYNSDDGQNFLGSK